MAKQTITFDDDEWQLVPKKPTPAMLGRARSVTSSWLNFTGSQATVNYKKMVLRYRAMLAVAPCPYERDLSWDQANELAEAERATVYNTDLQCCK